MSFQSARTKLSSEQAYSYSVAALTDKGRKRSNNEDAADVDMVLGLAVLADGMGAHAAGEIASDWTVRHFMAAMPHLMSQAADAQGLAVALRTLAQQANERIVAHAQRDPDTQGMGSTVVVAAPVASDMVIGHLGDSRAYLCRGGSLQRLTSDHKWLDEQVAMGILTPEQARASKQTNALTRALGIEEEVDMAVKVVPVHDRDIFLLCTDGLTDMLPDGMIEHVLTQGSGYPAAMGQRLIDLANQKGGKDNIGVVVMCARKR